jgi:hypothetical protein
MNRLLQCEFVTLIGNIPDGKERPGKDRFVVDLTFLTRLTETFVSIQEN